MNTNYWPVTARNAALFSNLQECHQQLITAISSHQKLNRRIRIFMTMNRFLPFKVIVKLCRRQHDELQSQFTTMEKLRSNLLVTSLMYSSQVLTQLKPDLSGLFHLQEETIRLLEEQVKTTRFPRALQNMKRIAYHLAECIRMIFQVIDAGTYISVKEPICLN